MWGVNLRYQTEPSDGIPAFMEDQAVEVVGEVGQDPFRLGPGQPSGADEPPEAVLVMREDVLDGSADG